MDWLVLGDKDIFYCKHFEVIDGSIFPFDPQNIGATFNTHNDEMSLRSFKEGLVLSRGGTKYGA
jgi:hypothetical protein